MRMILLGSPGSGKGTIAQELCNRYPFTHVSTGDLFRKNIQNETPLGQEIRSYLAAGELVPDALTIRLVEDVLQDPHILQHFLLDGFPRTLNQAQSLETCLHRMGAKLDVALHVQVPDEIIQKRLAGRRVCKSCGRTYHVETYPTRKEGICDSCGGPVEQRQDDKPEVIARRLQSYHEITAPLVDYYRQEGILVELDNTGNFEDTMRHLCTLLNLKQE